MTNPQPPTLISVNDDMPDPDRLVCVYSERDNLYGYARWVTRRKYGSELSEWQFDERQSIENSPISHWYPKPVIS